MDLHHPIWVPTFCAASYIKAKGETGLFLGCFPLLCPALNARFRLQLPHHLIPCGRRRRRRVTAFPPGSADSGYLRLGMPRDGRSFVPEHDSGHGFVLL